jgi:putative intracellular protease/amidase
MARTILVPLPDCDFDVTEVAVPWKLLTRAGHTVVFVTERGGRAPAADPLLLTGVIFGQLGAEPEPRRWYHELTEAPEFTSPRAWSGLDVAEFDALLLPGGHAPGMRQYLGSAELHGLIARFHRLARPTAAICHGVLAAARSGILRERTTTCLPRYMERTAYWLTAWKLGRYYRTYPAYVEDEVRAALADPRRQFIRGPLSLVARGTDDDDRAAFVVEDDLYVSARWPGDAYLFAKKLLARL